MKGKVIFHSEFCKGCKLCVEFCPKGSIVLSKKLNAKGYSYAEFDTKKTCTGCGTCAVICPDVVIEVYRE